jgi:hypothetical protein
MRPMKTPPMFVEHWIRVHRPFSHPKQWVKMKDGGLGFTDNQFEGSRFTLEQANEIIADFHKTFPGFVVTMDGI